MSGGYFGDKYFPGGYFPNGFFGAEGEADPNALRGTFAGGATFTGTLSAQQTATVAQGGGGGAVRSRGAHWVRVDRDDRLRIEVGSFKATKPRIVAPSMVPVIAARVVCSRPEINPPKVRADETMDVLALLSAMPARGRKDDTLEIMRLLAMIDTLEKAA